MRRRIAMCPIEREVEVALLGFRGHPRAGAATLRIYDDDGNFRHACKAESLGHQREAGASGGSHALDTRPRGTEAGVDGGDFVFALQERHPSTGGSSVASRSMMSEAGVIG